MRVSQTKTLCIPNLRIRRDQVCLFQCICRSPVSSINYKTTTTNKNTRAFELSWERLKKIIKKIMSREKFLTDTLAKVSQNIFCLFFRLRTFIIFVRSIILLEPNYFFFKIIYSDFSS